FNKIPILLEGHDPALSVQPGRILASNIDLDIAKCFQCVLQYLDLPDWLAFKQVGDDHGFPLSHIVSIKCLNVWHLDTIYGICWQVNVSSRLQSDGVIESACDSIHEPRTLLFQGMSMIICGRRMLLVR